MQVVFRVDASLQIGSGHVMRCLTLADILASHGVTSHFISRAHGGHLIEYVRRKGYKTHVLPSTPHPPYNKEGLCQSQMSTAHPAHISWLGCSQHEDGITCKTILEKLQPDWLIVDHYALDATWEEFLQTPQRKLMVIDDLADRPHACNLLLDQNLGRTANDYTNLIPPHCKVLVGPQYALLRPEFAKLRQYSLQRRKTPQARHLLITMGGVDQCNATSKVLEALNNCAHLTNFTITVVMGQTAPHLIKVQKQVTTLPCPTRVLVNVKDMANQIANSDIVIGAAGSSSWERCCLGLPSLTAILADNQLHIDRALADKGATLSIGSPKCGNFKKQIAFHLSNLLNNKEKLKAMSVAAACITNGSGAQQVARWVTKK